MQIRTQTFCKKAFTIFVAVLFSACLHAGTPAFTFNLIAADAIRPSPCAAAIVCSASGTILMINDGKQTPLLLGSIPHKQEHIAQLHKTLWSAPNPQAPILLVTLTEQWECDISGLTDLLQQNKQLVQCHYPTRDRTPPTFVDLLCAVQDVETRDARAQTICLVHCKYGRGRSALVVAAYLAHVLYSSGYEPVPKHIEAYLAARRPGVFLQDNQRDALAYFCVALQKASSFEALCALYKGEMEERRK